ncbi:MAG: hypothetical protein COA99_12605 [Moraxellaceae bacterium]|nr:MAG: hypothetical protein COA99_12605 [Moraxellaceae bacterium]
MPVVSRFLIIAGLLLICGYGLYTSYTRGNANGWYFKADFALNAWAKAGKIEDSNAYQEALAAIQKAHAMDPGHPHYVHMLGRILHQGVDYQFEPNSTLAQVKDLYLQATELRPLWPDPWIDLARLNNYLHGYNDDTRYYLKQAMAVGPFIDLVTLGALQVLLENWTDLTGADRTLLFEQFAVAVKQPKVLKAVLVYARQVNREKIVCLQLKFNPEYKQQKLSSMYAQFCR